LQNWAEGVFQIAIGFFLNWVGTILEIALGGFIAKQWRAYILNFDSFFFKLGISDFLNSTMWSNHEYRNCNWVILVQFAT